MADPEDSETQEFTVMNEQDLEEYKIKQLGDRNDLRGTLRIFGLENVGSKEEALEANLAAKERLTVLELCWERDSRRPNAEAEAQVIEGLCPPVQLQHLEIWDFHGSSYPSWIVGAQSGGPTELRRLFFWRCSQLGPAPKLENFLHLQLLWLDDCSWDALPDNMERLSSLKKLFIIACLNIRWLPALPPSLEELNVVSCDAAFTRSCQTTGHPNWQKIEHIPKKMISC
ncbi:hypothetical protein SETIT_8G064600v2 [Setaria italica]|uniref:R13L1/DRL21-like LRR repeat region domain-containing protein n=1 Tax=Setaria italica TaxID=4555 RepID=A0A368S4V6_SETIT|nr:putative disease resistance protein RGA3 isoform X2 [Setaria italica]RCV37459.1 hypothetical protein SETIT_8G064600v2 [Setaria italica]RCV37460.1 hypothetical protein SETIT_8G064600v2 [Setaria italica]